MPTQPGAWTLTCGPPCVSRGGVYHDSSTGRLDQGSLAHGTVASWLIPSCVGPHPVARVPLGRSEVSAALDQEAERQAVLVDTLKVVFYECRYVSMQPHGHMTLGRAWG